MIAYYSVLGLTLCLCPFLGGSPLRDDSLTQNPQQYTGRDGTPRLEARQSGVRPASFIPSVNYSTLVDFYLFQRINDEIQVTQLPVDAQEIAGTGFIKSRETKFVIHGYANDLNSDFTQQVARAYASGFDYNVIAVDWGKITMDNVYPTARYHVEGVGNYVGNFITDLYHASLVEPSGLHLIGHSLGAHVAGYAGKHAEDDGYRIGRITGLDPAGVLFSDPIERLTRDDADLVDVIHTCMNYLGIAGNIGHVDFYPNGGTAVQPGCSLDLTGACSHGRSFEFFVESIRRPDAFIGQACESEYRADACVSTITAVMGAWIRYTEEGAYFLATSASPPFGLNDNVIDLRSTGRK